MIKLITPLIFFVLLGFSGTTLAVPKTVIILRHAEEPPFGTELSEKGFLRAEKLADYFSSKTFQQNFGAIDFLMAVKPKDSSSSIRSYQTLLTSALRLHKTIDQQFLKDDTALLGKTILTAKEYDHKIIVIAWSHKKIGDLARSLGIKDLDLEWKNGVFDRFWVLQYKPNHQTLIFKDLPQKLLEGDSEN